MIKSPFLWLPLAFIAGGLVGAWGPSEELRSLEERPAAAQADTGKRHGFDTFTRMVNIPDVARRRRPSRAAAGHAVTNAVSAAAPSGEVSVTHAPAPASARPPASPEDLRVRIEQAAELWRTRSELVRAGAIKTLALDAQGEERFDAAVERMNSEILASVQAIADALANEEELTPELGMRLVGDLAATMAETYDLIGETAGEDLRGEVSKLRLVELVDPAVAEPLVEVQGKLEGLPLRGRRR